MTMTDDTPTSVKSAVRVLDLFELLSRAGEMPHADIAGALAIPKSSLTQLLRTLVARDYVEFSPVTKGYRLGSGLSRLSQRTNAKRDLMSIVQPLLEEITRATSETSALNQLKGDMAEVVATVPSPQRLLSNMHLGDIAPLYATSGGKAILAHLPDASREAYIADVAFEPITPKTIRSRRELKRQIDAVRKEAIAFSFEEFTPGIIGVGVPLLTAAGQPLGSINIAIPAIRYDAKARDRAALALRQAAERVRRQLA